MHYQKELISFIKNKKEEQGVISTNIPALRFYITNEPFLNFAIFLNNK